MRSRAAKSLTVFLAIFLCVSMVACGGGGTSSTTSTSTANSGAATVDQSTSAATTQSSTPGTYVKKDYSKDPPLKVSFTGIAWGNGAVENGLVEQEFEQKLNLDITVSWIPYTDYVNRLNMMMVSGNVSDVTELMAVGGKYYYPQVIQAIDNGLFRDLKPYVIDSGFKDANQIMKNWSDSVWQKCEYNGKLYLLPRKLNEMADQSAVYYRKDIADKAGLKEPTNVDELADFIINMSKAVDNGMYGLDSSFKDIDKNLKMITVAYTGIQDWGIDAGGNFFYQSFMPEYKDFLSWVKKLYDAGAMDPEFILDQSTTSKFEDGKSATKIKNWRDWNQSEDLTTTKWFSSAVDPKAQVWAVGPLQGSKAPAVSIGDGSGYTQPVLISSKFSEANLDRLLQAISQDTEDYLWFLHYGDEGTHYTMVDGQPEALTDEQKAAKKDGYIGGWNQIFLDSDPDYVNSKFVRAHSSQAMIDAAQKMKDTGDQYITQYKLSNPILTLNSDTYNNQWTTITKDLIDNRAKVVMGQMSMEDWDAYVQSIVNSKDYKSIQDEFKAAYSEANK